MTFIKTKLKKSEDQMNIDFDVVTNRLMNVRTYSAMWNLKIYFTQYVIREGANVVVVYMLE